MQKYGFDDARPILERASARETATRVALGEVAKRFIRQVAWTIDGGVARDPARRILVVLNGEPTQQRLTLPAGRWDVLADHDAAGTEPQGTVSGTATLEAWSMLVATQ